MTEFAEAYGLRFQSDLALPEFMSAGATDAVDVHIRRGTVPAELEHPDEVGVLFEARPQEFLLKMPGIARFLVRNGAEIIVDAEAGASEHEVRVFMLGSCIGALLHQRHVLVLHAAAIGTEDGAVLFAGRSGAGKSTLLGEFLRRGHRMMVDDVCAVVGGADGAPPIVQPGYPRTRLWADSARRLEIETDDLLRTRPSLEKFELQVSDRFWDRPVPFRHFFVLNEANIDVCEVEHVSPVDAFSVLLNNTYRRRFMSGLGMHKPHFAIASAVAANVPVSRVTRPVRGFDLASLAGLIESTFEGS